MRTKRKFILAAVAVLAVILICGIVGRIETHYERKGFVTEASAGTILIKDTTGNIWEITREAESEEFHIGDNVSMNMFTAGTSDITDDVIEKVVLS